MNVTRSSKWRVTRWSRLELHVPVGAFIFCIVGLVTVANTQDCTRNEAEVTATSRVCGKSCITIADCGRNRDCLCDDICGLSCIPYLRLDYCNEVPAIEGVTLTYFYPNRTFGTTVQGQCNDGYRYAQGDETRRCEGDANWSGHPYNCTLITCKDPPEVELASVGDEYVKASYNVGDGVYYSCNYGYYRVGGNYIQCTATGDWYTQYLDMVCRIKTCPSPSIDNGYIEGRNFEFGSMVTVHCNTGYELQGLPFMTCQASQTWSGYDRSCEIVTCPPLSAPANGNKRGTLYEYDSEVTLSCVSGYKLIGSSVLRCQADGSWSDQAPTCEEINCGMPLCHYDNFPSLTTLEGGEIITSTFKYDSIAYFRCDDGRRLEPDRRTSSRCTQFETWTEPCPICKESVDPTWPSVPSDEVVDTQPGTCTAEVTYNNATAADNSGFVYVTSRHSDGQTGNFFNLGITQVIFTAVDPSGNDVETRIMITVEDKEKPVIVCPQDETTILDKGESRAQVEWEDVTATDNCGTVTVTCSHSSGDNLGVGDTQVTCTATDISRNLAKCSFLVSVEDKEPPVFISPLKNITVLIATGKNITFVDVEEEVVVTDNVEVDGLKCIPGSGLFQIGQTEVTCTADDASGNQANHSFVVIVEEAASIPTTPALIATTSFANDKTLFQFESDEVALFEDNPKVIVSIGRQGNVSQTDKVCVLLTDSSSCSHWIVSILEDYCTIEECVEFEPQQTKSDNITVDFDQCVNGVKKKTGNKRKEIEEFFACVQLKIEGPVSKKKEYGSNINIVYHFKSESLTWIWILVALIILLLYIVPLLVVIFHVFSILLWLFRGNTGWPRWMEVLFLIVIIMVIVLVPVIAAIFLLIFFIYCICYFSKQDNNKTDEDSHDLILFQGTVVIVDGGKTAQESPSDDPDFILMSRLRVSVNPGKIVKEPTSDRHEKVPLNGASSSGTTEKSTGTPWSSTNSKTIEVKQAPSMATDV